MNPVKIVTYEDKYRDCFKSLNVEWLSDMFVVEPYDLSVLSDPEKYILSGGGNIWMALNGDNEVIGTCALMEHEKGYFELTKMAVSSKARGLGAGRKLLKFLIKESYKIDCKSLFLLTNTKCESAIHLYLQEGFVYDQQIREKYGASYERCNVGMVHKL